MPDAIRDGAGKGYLAKVNNKNQLLVRSTSLEQKTKSAIDGNYFEATSGLITLLNANEKGILYIRNDEDSYHMIIEKVFIDFWTSLNGTGVGTFRYYKNPTVTGGTSIQPICTDFSKTVLYDGNKKDLDTMTGECWVNGVVSQESAIVAVEGNINIPPGYSFGLSVQPPIGNTNMKVATNIAFYFIDVELL